MENDMKPLLMRADDRGPLQVRNLQGTSRHLCWCGSWIEHWRCGSGGGRFTCAVVGCSGPAEVGAHVKPVDLTGWYIAPFCKGCNHWSNREILTLDRRTWLVRANVSLTCAVWWAS
jgi:hypothetical protein